MTKNLVFDIKNPHKYSLFLCLAANSDKTTNLRLFLHLQPQKVHYKYNLSSLYPLQIKHNK